MAITYPITLPSHTGIRSVSFRASNAVAYSMSPFTFAGQAHKYPGQMWEADITLPPMHRSNAEQWNAFLMSLNGQAGTFLLGDPNGCVPRGSALSFKKNLLTKTEQFDDAVWTKGGATASTNIFVAPDGKNTADGLIEDSSLGSHSIQDSVSCTPLTTYSVSLYVKFVSGGREAVRLRLGDDTGFISDARVDLTDGTLYNPSSSNSISGYLDNGWLRVSVTGTTSATATSVNLTLELLESADSSVTYQGDGTSGVAIWGAQLEEGSVATEYQPIADAYGPFVNGAGQTGSELIIDGASPNEDGYLKAGDYIQLGSNSSARLHKVLADVATDDDGNATIDIWPAIRTSPADNATVIIENTVGKFRLAENMTGWNADVAQYGITFSAMEAV